MFVIILKIMTFIFYIADRDDVLRYAERLSMRCSTVDVLVTVQRDHVQQEALHQVCNIWQSHCIKAQFYNKYLNVILFDLG